jgi:Ca-activated chloride channel family protein
MQSPHPDSNSNPRTIIEWLSLKRSIILVLSVAMVAWLFYFGSTNDWSQLWFSPNQMGQRYFRQGNYIDAAQTFQDSQWRGVAWYRAGEFQKAAQYFSLRDTAEAHYNAGNAWLMLGKYEEATKFYDRALSRRPEWREAIENRDLAQARAKLVAQTGGDMGDQKIGADEIVFDKDAKNKGEQTETAGQEAMSDAAVQAMWLRRVQTRPADFLRAKFAYQQAVKTGQGD